MLSVPSGYAGNNERIFRVKGAVSSMAPMMPEEQEKNKKAAEALCAKLHESSGKNSWYYLISGTPDFCFVSSPLSRDLWGICEQLSPTGKEHLQQQIAAKAGFELIA